MSAIEVIVSADYLHNDDGDQEPSQDAYQANLIEEWQESIETADDKAADPGYNDVYDEDMP